MNKHIFIGLAWPYANGSLHLGHASAFIGADVLARYHRLAGDNVLFVSGSDCYGTPIAIEAAEKNINPKDIVEKYHQEFRQTLIDGLSFSYDLYTSTTSEYHTKVVQELFLDLYTKGYLYTKIEKALFSPLLNRFLPDRFVEGVCPHCGYDGARGDQCDECQTLLDPLELLNPRINSKLLGQREQRTQSDISLEVRESEHFYLKLTAMQNGLEQWVHSVSPQWRSNARGVAMSFLEQGLQDRAVTRDTDWGVPIPLPGYESKRIYVWFEAVCGYLSASVQWAQEKGQVTLWEEWWKNPQSKHYYVHGKDNIPFHTIIWPSMLLAEGGLHTPDIIVSSEYLNLEGKQFSKSRGWAVWLPEFLGTFDSETLRYYLVAHGPETSDANFYWSEYAHFVNAELIGTFGNLVNRVLSFSKKHFPEGVRFSDNVDEESQSLLSQARDIFPKIGDLIQETKFRSALREAFALAEAGNRYIDIKAPWIKMKDSTKRDEVEQDLAVLIQIIATLATILCPFLPKTSEKIFGFLQIEMDKVSWEYLQPRAIWHIQDITPLYQKIDDDEVQAQQLRLQKHI